MDSLNYFDLFNLPVQFSLDNEQLSLNYKKLIAQYHPDKVAAKSDFEKKQAVMMAATINKAFQTLRHPLDRASFMLKLKGLETESQIDTQFSPAFLMQQMEWRETLEDNIAQNNQTALSALYEEVVVVYQDTLAQLTQIFSEPDTQPAVALVRQGRFLDKLLCQIKEHIKK